MGKQKHDPTGNRLISWNHQQVTRWPKLGGSKTKKEPTRFLQRPLKASPNGLPAFKPLRPLEKPWKSWLVGKNIGIRNFSWRTKKNRPMNINGYRTSSPILTAFRTEVNWSLLKCYIQCGARRCCCWKPSIWDMKTVQTRIIPVTK